MQGTRPTLFLILALTIGTSGCAGPELRKVYTEHLGQLTGTLHNPSQAIGITGTDLGASFLEPASDKLIFLFGDSWTRNGERWDQDSAAWASPPGFPWILPERNKLPRIRWFGSGQFTQVKVSGALTIEHGGMNVPVEGLPLIGRIFIFFSTGWDDGLKRYCCSALAHTDQLSPDFDRLVLDRVVITDKFVNISAFVEGETVWLFGSGPYRHSSVYLARVHQSQIADRNSWQYYRGMIGGNPDFQPGEKMAAPIVDSTCVGELSVRKHPELGYLMLYNCLDETSKWHGINLHRADEPWGVWDSAITIFDPAPPVDKGYGYFIHQKASVVGYDDGLAEPGLHPEKIPSDKCPGFGWREECWGGEYGPYLVPQWFATTQDGGYSIVYTLSSWVPYQVHLMRTVLAKRGDSKPKPQASRTNKLPPASIINGDFGGRGNCHLGGWHGLGDSFGVFKGKDGRCWMTTFTSAKGDNAQGALFQDFTVDSSTKALRFVVHGGEATVRLHRGVEVVRETRGRSGYEPRNEGSIEEDIRVCWQLSEYDGETLRVAIFDGKVDRWGFIGVTDFEFLTKTCDQPPAG